MNHDESLKIVNASERDPGITLSDKALQHTRQWLKKTGGVGLRLTTKETGCSGLEYIVEIAEAVNNSDLKRVQDDIVLYVDKAAYSHLKGSHLDYVKDGLNFKFVFENPNAIGVCGCGESFKIKEDD